MAKKGFSDGPSDNTIPETHTPPPKTVAVAIHHDLTTPNTPHISASGRGWMAEQILALAFANGVKVRQDADLAQILAALDVDSEIPPEAFFAIAEILSYVYQANLRINHDWMKGAWE